MELSNPQHEAFAQHVASGLSLTEAAKRCNYSHDAAANSGSRLNRTPTIARRINELRELRGRSLQVAGLRNPQARVSALENRWERMLRIITERAAHPDYADVPGGTSGLLVMSMKTVGSGPMASIVREFKFDSELLRELRAHEEQAAQELGQWTTRKENYSQNVSLKLTNPTELSDVLKQHLGQIPVSDRRRLLEAEPQLVELATGIECTPESSIDNATDAE